LPNLVEITALPCVGSAECDDLKAALTQSCGERTPAGRRPLLVTEHRRGVDHRIGTYGNLFERRCRRTNHFGDTRNTELVGKPKHLLDAVNGCHVRRAAVKQAALDQITKPRPVRIDQAGMGSSGE
jgi:hypothetical protein